MANGWPVIKLGEVLTERRETPSPESIETGEVSIVSKIGFNAGKIELRNETKTKTGMILIRPGDLVISGINAVKGAIAIYSETAHKPVAATIHYGAYIPNKERVDIKFLWWFLRSATFRDIVQDHIPGGIKTELKAKRFLAVPVPLPPLTEQRRIVARIETLAARVAQAQSLRREADEETELLLAAQLKNIRHKLLESNYPKKKFGDITQVTSGGTPSRDNPTYWDGDIPWIKTGELVDGDIFEAEEHITEDGMKNSSAKLFPPETILIALYGQGQTRGRTARLMIEATTNQACCAILPTPEILESRFTQYWQRSLYYEMREKSHGGAQPNWNGGMIKNVEIALPALEEQRRLVAYLDGLQARVSALRAAQAETERELSALLPSVLDRAFKGEL